MRIRYTRLNNQNVLYIDLRPEPVRAPEPVRTPDPNPVPDPDPVPDPVVDTDPVREPDPVVWERVTAVAGPKERPPVPLAPGATAQDLRAACAALEPWALAFVDLTGAKVGAITEGLSGSIARGLSGGPATSLLGTGEPAGPAPAPLDQVSLAAAPAEAAFRLGEEWVARPGRCVVLLCPVPPQKPWVAGLLSPVAAPAPGGSGAGLRPGLCLETPDRVSKALVQELEARARGGRPVGSTGLPPLALVDLPPSLWGAYSPQEQVLAGVYPWFTRPRDEEVDPRGRAGPLPQLVARLADKNLVVQSRRQMSAPYLVCENFHYLLRLARQATTWRLENRPVRCTLVVAGEEAYTALLARSAALAHAASASRAAEAAATAAREAEEAEGAGDPTGAAAAVDRAAGAAAEARKAALSAAAAARAAEAALARVALSEARVAESAAAAALADARAARAAPDEIQRRHAAADAAVKGKGEAEKAAKAATDRANAAARGAEAPVEPARAAGAAAAALNAELDKQNASAAAAAAAAAAEHAPRCFPCVQFPHGQWFHLNEDRLRDHTELVQADGLALFVDKVTLELRGVLSFGHADDAHRGPALRRLALRTGGCVFHIRDGQVEVYDHQRLQLWYDGFVWRGDPFGPVRERLAAFFPSEGPARLSEGDRGLAARVVAALACLLDERASSLLAFVRTAHVSDPNLDGRPLLAPAAGGPAWLAPLRRDIESAVLCARVPRPIESLPLSALVGLLQVDGTHLITDRGELYRLAHHVQPEVRPAASTAPGTGRAAARQLSLVLTNTRGFVVKVSSSGALHVFENGAPLAPFHPVEGHDHPPDRSFAPTAAPV